MGIASIAAGFLESGPTIEGNDERLAMIARHWRPTAAGA
jgi:hypothetical protein